METALPGAQASAGGVLHVSCLGRGVSALTGSHGELLGLGNHSLPSVVAVWVFVGGEGNSK